MTVSLVLSLLSALSQQPELESAWQRITEARREAVVKLGNGYELTRSPRIQYRLLREDLHWQAMGYSDRQLSLIAALSLRSALVRAESVVAAPSDEERKVLDDITLFVIAAEEVLAAVAEELGTVTDADLNFALPRAQAP